MSPGGQGTWIERVRIDAFGHLTGTELVLSSGLNALCGPNEAGKSTLLAFLRWMLFGFEKRSVADRYEPQDGAMISGELLLQTPTGPLIVKRKGRKRLDGELSVRTPRGEPVPPGRLEDAVGSLSRDLYFQVFAFGLDELATFDELASQGAVSDALFAAGVQGAQRLPEALKRLRDGSEELFAPRAGTRPLNQLMGELETAQKELAALGDRPAKYFELCGRRDLLEAEWSAADTARVQARAQLERWTRLAGAREDLLRLAEVEKELAALPVLDAFPEDGVARLEARIEEERRAVRERDAAELELRRVEHSLERQGQAPAIAAVSEEARAVLDRFRAVAELGRQVPEAERQLSSSSSEMRSRAEALGLLGGFDGLIHLDLSAAAAAKLLTIRDALATSTLQLSERGSVAREAQAEVGRRREALQRLEAEWVSLDGPALAQLRAQAAALSQVAPLRAERRTHLEAVADRRARTEALEADVAAAPRHALPVGLAIIASAVLALIPAGLLMFGGAAFAPYAVAGFAGLMGIVWWLQVRAHRAHREALATWQLRGEARRRELARLAREVGEHLRAASECDQLLASVAREASLAVDASLGAVAAEQQRVEEGLRRAEARERLESLRPSLQARLAEATAAATAATHRLTEGEALHARLLEELDGWLAVRGFPRGLSAERAVELMRDAAQLQEAIAALSVRQSEVTVQRAHWDKTRRSLLELAARCGLAAEDELSAARAISEALEAERTRAAACAQWEVQRGTLGLAHQQRIRAAEEARAARVALFVSVGVEDEESFRQRAAEAQRFRAARALRSKLRTVVEARVASVAEAAWAEVGAAGGWDRVLTHQAGASVSVERFEAECKRLAEERGAVRKELEGLETDAQAQKLRAEEESLKLRIQTLADRYAVERVALALVETAKRRYEEDHQPRLLKLASTVFSTLTSGRYVQVRAPESHRGLVAVAPDGVEWAAERLSRGTREQLYLAFRIAAVEDLGESRVRLPVIVDDVLVNFDATRADAAADALAELSGRHQVLTFTCHPHMAELFTRRGARALALRPTGQQQLLRLPASA